MLLLHQHLHTSLQAHLQQFLLSNTLCPPIKEKYFQVYQEAKNHNLKRQSKHQNQTWQSCWELLVKEFKTTMINIV